MESGTYSFERSCFMNRVNIAHCNKQIIFGDAEVCFAYMYT